MTKTKQVVLLERKLGGGNKKLKHFKKEQSTPSTFPHLSPVPSIHQKQKNPLPKSFHRHTLANSNGSENSNVI